ncbi:MAG: RNA polymerase II mediator complex subunit [Cirrosporium novae-zelandiae]|nr:MAG: RNA polymerase II mediator complex subunit [Cirrosporium novae-zelandiae]
MAPSILDQIDETLKDTIQVFYEIQVATHGYLGPDTQKALVRKIIELNDCLARLSRYSRTLSPTSPTLPPEILQYVDKGRNPDIYAREFVELVQKGNRFMKGKSEAFGRFADRLSEKIVELDGFTEGEVRRVWSKDGKLGSGPSVVESGGVLNDDDGIKRAKVEK